MSCTKSFPALKRIFTLKIDFTKPSAVKRLKHELLLYLNTENVHSELFFSSHYGKIMFLNLFFHGKYLKEKNLLINFRYTLVVLYDREV